VDAICHVVRNFHLGDIIHVDGRVDPAHDAEVIDIELAFADLEIVTKHLVKLKDKLKGASAKEEKDARKLVEFLQTKIITALENGQGIRKLGLSAEELEGIKYLSLLTAKPMIYLLNVDEDKVKEIPQIPFLQGEVVIPICAKVEADLAELSETEAKEYLTELGVSMSGLDNIILEAYKVLDLISFLTTGPKETRAWTIERGTKAPQAAGKIHGDFERGFIAVEIINWQNLINAGSEALAKEGGLIRLEGKEYVVQDGDCCNFRFNV